jgi:hypothetical protein
MDWKDCKKNQIWDGDKKACIRLSTTKIGDGKLPNKYWVGIHEDYYVETEPGTLDWASGVKDIKVDGRTVAVFKKYSDAKRFIEEESILFVIDANASGDEKKIFGLTPRGTTIEDRISGEVYHYTLEEVNKLASFEREDFRFTKEKMEEKGHKFE